MLHISAIKVQQNPGRPAHDWMVELQGKHAAKPYSLFANIVNPTTWSIDYAHNFIRLHYDTEAKMQDAIDSILEYERELVRQVYLRAERYPNQRRM